MIILILMTTIVLINLNPNFSLGTKCIHPEWTGIWICKFLLLLRVGKGFVCLPAVHLLHIFWND